MAGCATVVALLAGAAAAEAKTFEVTRHNDPNPGKCKPKDCSLREAVLAANSRDGRDKIVLPDRKGAYNLTRGNGDPVTSEDAGKLADLDVHDTLTILHPGGGLATIDANRKDRVLEVHDGWLVTKKLKLKGGRALYAPGEGPRAPHAARRGDSTHGGAIQAGPGALLTVLRSVVTGNEAERGAVEGAFGSSTVFVLKSRIANNQANGAIGKLSLKRSKVLNNAGTGINPRSDSHIHRSTISGNSHGAFIEGSDVRITDSTINGNEGSGITLSSGSAQVTNTTVTGNVTPNFGAGVSASFGELSLNSVTIARNRVVTDGLGHTAGILVSGGASVGIVNSILADNRTNGVLDDCSVSDAPGPPATLDSDGGNVITSEGTCSSFEPGGGDFLTSNAKLGSLKQNGGPTKTMALKAGSPAVGAAIEAASPARDQRGEKRDGNPDSGAFER